MKIITEKSVADGNDELIVLLFENDEERIRIAKQLLNYQPREGKRAWAQYPDDKMTHGHVTDFVTPFIIS